MLYFQIVEPYLNLDYLLKVSKFLCQNVFCFVLFCFPHKGVAGLAVGHPADTIKVRQQAFTEKIGVLRTLRTTLKYEGVRLNYIFLKFASFFIVFEQSIR